MPGGSEKLWKAAACAGNRFPYCVTVWYPTSSSSPPFQVMELSKLRQTGESQVPGRAEESTDLTTIERTTPIGITVKRSEDRSELLAHTKVLVMPWGLKILMLNQNCCLRDKQDWKWLIYWEMSAVQSAPPSSGNAV